MLLNIDQLCTLRFHTPAILYIIVIYIIVLVPDCRYWLLMQVLWYLSAASGHTPIYCLLHDCMTSGKQYIAISCGHVIVHSTTTIAIQFLNGPTIVVPLPQWKVQYIFPHPWKIGSCWIQVEVQLTGILNPKSFWKICS